MGAETAPSGGSSIEMWRSGGEERVLEVALQRRIWEEFGREPMLEGADLRVEVTDAIALLDGVMDHYLAKATAEAAVRRVEGIRGVDSRVRVRPRGPHARTDADIAGDAARALRDSPLALARRITVRVVEGAVTLAGEAARAAERVAAEELVGRLPGVTAVRNEIVVRPTARPPHFEVRLREAVEREHIRRIAVELRGDTVVLRGRVRSLAQRDRLERAVATVPGVAAVADEIEIVI